MKTALPLVFLLLFGMNSMMAQDRTTVRANSIDISDNLDLRAVAYLFGESRDLEDFERRLNDPTNPLSNLDLNNDNQVDYLRVIESVENRSHLIIIQAVIGREIFQDVATVEVDRDNQNRMQVQVVGDVFLYGQNYIYEPVYYHTPIIYNTFWVSHYRPYCSPWYWNYYPSHFYVWNPFPVFYYQNHINIFIGTNYTCHFVNYRRSRNCIAMHHSRRMDGYERYYNGRSFQDRNRGFSNRNELAQTREVRANNYSSDRNNTHANNQPVRSNSVASQYSPRATSNNSYNTPRPSVRTNGTRDIAISNASDYASANTYENPRPRVKNTREEMNLAQNQYSTSSTYSSPRPRVKSRGSNDVSFSSSNHTTQTVTESPRPRVKNDRNNVYDASTNSSSSSSTFQNPRTTSTSSSYVSPKPVRESSTTIQSSQNQSYNSTRPQVKSSNRSSMSLGSSTNSSGRSSSSGRSLRM